MGSSSSRWSASGVGTIKAVNTGVSRLAMESIASCGLNTSIMMLKVLEYSSSTLCKIGINTTKVVAVKTSRMAITATKLCVSTTRDAIVKCASLPLEWLVYNIPTKEGIKSAIATVINFYQLVVQEVVATANGALTGMLHKSCRSICSTYEAGDILYRRLKGVKGMFYHYGVYIGKNEVIQFMSSGEDGTEGVLEKLSLDNFLDGCNEFWVQRRFKYEAKHKKDVCRKAFEIYQLDEEQEDWSVYNWRKNNCEHFANYCATGHKYSRQAII